MMRGLLILIAAALGLTASPALAQSMNFTPGKTGPLILCQSGSASSHTGDTTETVLATCAVPANAMGKNGQIEIDVLFSKTGTAGAPTYRIKYGGTAFHGITNTSTALSYEAHVRVSNQNATNAQIGATASTPGGWGSSTSAPNTGSVDSTAAQNITISVQGASAADTITLQSYIVILYPNG